jgi:hypothetical protein
MVDNSSSLWKSPLGWFFSSVSIPNRPFHPGVKPIPISSDGPFPNFLAVLPLDMVDKSTGPRRTHFVRIFGDETVQVGLLFPA